uniref:NADH-ubiquinone oxidoreductase chain 6 n=1 Tax=Fuelleborniella sp. FuspCA TaxID=2597024 RepID=A0A8K1ZFG6_9NEOP|nr:NADH dehydrogenase subunit 6 [Fuelleborniella sp. FuspCA]
MYYILMIFTIMLSIMFIYSINPLTLGLILICQSITLSLFFSPMIKSFWFFYLLLLIFIGGMMVLFMYVTTLFPNEKFIINQSNLIYLILFTTMLIFSSSMLILYTKNINCWALNYTPSSMEYSFMYYTIKIFNSYSNYLFLLMVIYLFYAMIIMIKIINFFKGPLRKMNYV